MEIKTRDRLPLWLFLWALACLEDRHYRAELPRLFSGHGWEHLPELGMIATALFALCRPRSGRALVALAFFSAANLLWQMPEIANDSVIILFVDFLLLAAALRARKVPAGEEFLEAIAPAARVLVILVYALAAFHKLNWGFFAPEGGCAGALSALAARSLGLGGLMPPIGPGLAGFVSEAVIGAELAIPALLAFPATRLYGLGASIAFHLVMGLTVDTFSTVMLALDLFFVAPEVFASVRAKLGSRLHAAALALALPMMGYFYWRGRATTEFTADTRRLWFLAALASVGAFAWLARPGFALLRERLRAPRFAQPILALFVVSGLGPYLGFHTRLALDMYSNLRVERESNHLLVPKGLLQVFSEPDDLVAVLDSNAPYFDRLAREGLRLPRLELGRQLALERARGHGDTTVRVSDGRRVASLRADGDDTAFLAPVPWWKRKLFSFRPVPARDDNRCQW